MRLASTGVLKLDLWKKSCEHRRFKAVCLLPSGLPSLLTTAAHLRSGGPDALLLLPGKLGARHAQDCRQQGGVGGALFPSQPTLDTPDLHDNRAFLHVSKSEGVFAEVNKNYMLSQGLLAQFYTVVIKWSPNTQKHTHTHLSFHCTTFNKSYSSPHTSLHPTLMIKYGCNYDVI